MYYTSTNTSALYQNNHLVLLMNLKCTVFSRINITNTIEDGLKKIYVNRNIVIKYFEFINLF